MNLKKLLKITGIIIGPLVPLVFAVYFLYPYFNEEGYQNVVKQNKYLTTPAGTESRIAEDFETVKEQANIFREDNIQLRNTMDSLHTVIDSLENALLDKTKELEEISRELTNLENKEEEEAGTALAENMEEVNKEFVENIKSFLSLDEENLAPIINEMSDDQLVRIYKEAGSLERKKLLRSLESKRAAQLMTEVM